MEYTELLTYIRQIMRFIHVESKLLEKQKGISIPQLLALNYLNRQKGYTATHGQLGRFLVLNPSTITGIVSRLEKKGVVARIPGEADKRTSNVILTKQGQHLLVESLQWINKKFEKQLKNNNDGQKERLIQSFEEIIRFVSIKDKEVEKVMREIND